MASETMTAEEFRRELERLRREYEEKLASAELQKTAERHIIDRKAEEARKANEAYLNEYVAIKLFRDNDRYKDDVYVAVNGKNCIIKRGEWVRVKRKFALVLDQSEIQDMRTAAYLEAEQNRFAEQTRSVGQGRSATSREKKA